MTETQISGNSRKTVQHHTKYIELHGVDEIVEMTVSDHTKLHNRLRREGKCNVPPDELAKISTAANKRSPKSKAWQRAYDAEHSDRINAYHKAYNAKHREYINARQRAYNAEHRDERNAYNKMYRAARKLEAMI